MNNYPDAGYTPANLRHWMQQHQMTEADVAARLNCQVRAVQRWLTDPSKNSYRSMDHRTWLELTIDYPRSE